ncbi:unannotated protein [freshwater metagenome]|jgi:mannose-6-phosphate isomerase-like protein (cupin superfamily)|uniref:Unannotated protein n=1 Tax=freshwater metagenome TaxID=449393 RepID=A0A6J7IXM7_9ZZZZ|nr:cupin domain-containing protein [Actinomycetota bacterium]
MEQYRRVVTGVDDAGKSVFISDEALTPVQPPLLGGVKVLQLFGEDAIPTVPNDGTFPDDLRFFASGRESYRFMICSYPPASEVTPPEDIEAATAETERLAPGILDLGPQAYGLHYTPSVDFIYVLGGEVTITLDDGATTVLRQGDSLMQCGARHAWANNGDTWATFLCGTLGADLDETRHAPAA